MFLTRMSFIGVHISETYILIPPTEFNLNESVKGNSVLSVSGIYQSLSLSTLQSSVLSTRLERLSSGLSKQCC